MSNYTVLSNDTSDNLSFSGWKKVFSNYTITGLLTHLVLAIIVIINLLLNLKAIYEVCSGLNGQRLRNISSRFLIVQVSIISIGFSLTTIYINIEELGFQEYQNRPSCELLGFTKSVLIYAFLTNMGTIFYDLARNYDEYRRISEICIYRLILLVWIPAVVQGLPVYLLITDSEETSNTNSTSSCTLVDFYGSKVLYTLIDVIQFSLFHIGLLIYMIRVLLSIRSKLQRLYYRLPNARRRLENQILATRFLCIHLVLYILLWAPFELVLLITRIIVVFKHNEVFTGNVYTNLILFIFLVLNSRVNLTLLQNNMSVWPGWCYCWCICLPQRTFRQNDLQRAHMNITQPSMVRTQATVESEEASMMTTVQREEQNIPSTSRRSMSTVSACDIRDATSMIHGRTRQERISMIDIVDLAGRASESRESGSENDTSESSVGLMKETQV